MPYSLLKIAYLSALLYFCMPFNLTAKFLQLLSQVWEAHISYGMLDYWDIGVEIGGF